MKLSAAVSTPDARFSALALKGTFETTFSIIHKHGLDGVEIAVRDPASVDVAALRALMAEFSLAVPAIGTGRAFGEDGLSFSDPDPEVRQAATQRILGHIDLAHALGANVIIGLILGKIPRTPRTETHAVECMRLCAGYAVKNNISLLVEPINRYETGFIITADDCLSFLDLVAMPNCKVLLDTFHANIEEADIYETIRRAGPRIGHVHVADSNRRHPGAGHLDFSQIINTLHAVGYSGYLSAEMFPDPDPDTALAAMSAHLRAIMKETTG